MSNYYELDVGGHTLKLAIRARDHADLQKALGGKTLLEAVFDSKTMGDPLDVFAKVLRIASRKHEDENGKIDSDAAYDIYDQLIDDGKNVNDVVNILIGIGEMAGFFTPEMRQGYANAMEEQRKTLLTMGKPDEGAGENER